SETNTLYLGQGAATFEDKTAASGLGPPSAPYTGFGACFFDADLDGDLDCAIANGRVTRGPRLVSAPRDPFWADYAEPNLLFENVDGRFVDASAKAGAFAREIEVSRALIPGDMDDDGDVDLVVTNVEGPARLYLNEAPRSGHWLEVSAFDPERKRVASGAEVVVVAGSRERVAAVAPATSYLSSGDARV